MSKKDINVSKGIAILTMIFYHLFYQLDLQQLSTYLGLVFTESITSWMAKTCHVCVPLFVFASAYGLTKIEKANEGVADSYKKSVKRYFQLVLDMSFVLILMLLITYVIGNEHNATSVWGQGLFDKIIGVISNVSGMAGKLGVAWYSSPWCYTSIAICIIFLVPLLYPIVKKIGPYNAIVLGMVLLQTFALDVRSDSLTRYFPVLIFGMVWAEFEIDRYILEYCNKNKKIYFAICTILFALIPLLAYVKTRVILGYLVEALLAVVIVNFNYLCLSKVRILRNVLAFIGENSKYMWLNHSLITAYWFSSFLHTLNNVWLIWGISVVLSLGLAISMTYGKKIFIEKMWDIDIKSNRTMLIVSVVSTVLVYVVTILTSSMAYMTNDDFGIQGTLSGSFTGKPYPMHQFINVILSFFISKVYSVLPQVQWWYVWSQLLMAVGIFLIHYGVIKISQKYKMSLVFTWLILGFFDIVFFVYPIGSVSFTIVPAILGVGIVVCLFGLEDIPSVNCRKRVLIFSILGYLIALMHRKDSGFAILCYIFMAMLYYYVSVERDLKQAILKFSKMLIVMLMLTVSVVTINKVAQKNQNGQEFVAFNTARIQYVDYPHTNYQENPELFEEVQWNSDVEFLVNNWCFLDDNVTTEAFEHITKNKEQKRLLDVSALKALYKNNSCRPILMVWFASILILLVTLLYYTDKKILCFCFFNNIGTMILFMYQILTGRALFRSMIIIVLPATVINMILSIKNRQQRESNMLRYLILILTLCCLVPSLEIAFNGERRETVNAMNERFYAVEQYMEEKTENFYVIQTLLTNNISPWVSNRKQNNIYWGGSSFYSKEFYERLNANGYDELTGEIFENDNVYLISSCDAINDVNDNLFKVFFRRLKKNHGVIGFVKQDTIIDGAYVYHFVFESNKDNYETYYDIVDGMFVEIR